MPRHLFAARALKNEYAALRTHFFPAQKNARKVQTMAAIEE
jgi:hypothetical protein